MEIARADRTGAPRALLLAAGLAAGLAGLALVTLDGPAARAIGAYEPLPVWEPVLTALDTALGLELFSWLTGVALVAGMLAALALPRWRGHAPAWMWLAATHVLARIATNELKDLTGRLRPGPWLGRVGKGELEAGVGGVLDGFGAGGAAFPSGHVTIYASLLVPLAVVLVHAGVRRGLALGAPAAVIAFVMAARIGVNAHWASDTLGALAVVGFTAWATSWAIRPLRRPPPAASSPPPAR